MTVSKQDFLQHLAASGVLTPEDMAAAQRDLEPTAVTAEELARRLVKAGLLTKFQAQRIYQGRSEGLLLGDYVLVEPIGAGGMGQVFLAEHRRMRRRVALKMLPPAVAHDAMTRQRFEREVQAAARLSHPNIVTAFDASEANGVHYLVMEYVSGTDLSKRVRTQGPLSLTQSLDFVRQAARGLRYAHQQGIIHRDIKPSNMLVDDNGTIKILDMGLARFDTPGENAGQGALTETGTMMGTVDYMAPEQAVDTRQADARSDIYSLGCVLFYLLTGRQPYPGDTIIKKVLAHREHPVPSLRDLHPEIPASVDALFHRMIAKDPTERFQSMDEVIDAIDSEGRLDGDERTGGRFVGSAEDTALDGFLTALQQSSSPTSAAPASRTVESAATLSPGVLPETLDGRAGRESLPHNGSHGPPKKRLWMVGGGLLFTLLLIVMLITFRPPDRETPVENLDGPWGANDQNARHSASTSEPTELPPTTNEPRHATGSSFALAFDGIDDYVEVPTLRLDDIPVTQPLTIEATLRIDSTQVSNPISWFGEHWISLFCRDGEFGAGRLTGTGSLLQTAPLGERREAALRVAIVWDGAGWMLFREGRLVEGFPIGFDLQPTTGGLFIGGAPMQRLTGHVTGRWFQGVIDEIRISRTARYSENYAPVDRLEPDTQTLALYHFDTGEGESLRDSSGNEHHGRVFGATWVPTP